MSGSRLTRVRDEAELEEALEAPLAVLYKHSPVCGLSAMAEKQIAAFMAANPAVPVYQVDVLRDRPLSAAVARVLAVRHESPQAFVLRGGDVAWHGSHRAVTVEALERATADSA